MNDERAKRGIWIASLLSLVVGALIAIYTYGTLLSFRSVNLIGLIFITFIGLYAVMVVMGARKSAAGGSEAAE